MDRPASDPDNKLRSGGIVELRMALAPFRGITITTVPTSTVYLAHSAAQSGHNTLPSYKPHACKDCEISKPILWSGCKESKLTEASRRL